DLLAGEDVAGVAEEQGQQGLFLGREVERAARALGAARDQVDSDVALAEDHVRGPFVTTDHRADAGQQLGERKRLAEIVIGPAVQTSYPVANLVAGGQEDHGGLAAGPAIAVE